MKISQADLQELLAKTPEEKWQIVCGDIKDDGAATPVALLLGTNPDKAIERAKAAAELYRAGRVEHIVPSGGVEWEYEGKMISEANLMARVLQESGVPAEAIILENEARTTKENMIYGTLQINRALSFEKINKVTVVTSIEHMKRSLVLAKTLLPRNVQIHCYPALPEGGVGEWLAARENRDRVDHEIKTLHRFARNGFAEDFEIAQPCATV